MSAITAARMPSALLNRNRPLTPTETRASLRYTNQAVLDVLAAAAFKLISTNHLAETYDARLVRRRPAS